MINQRKDILTMFILGCVALWAASANAQTMPFKSNVDIPGTANVGIQNVTDTTVNAGNLLVAGGIDGASAAISDHISIGTTAETFTLDVVDSGNAFMRVKSTGGNAVIDIDSKTTGNISRLRFSRDSVPKFLIGMPVGVNTFNIRDDGEKDFFVVVDDGLTGSFAINHATPDGDFHIFLADDEFDVDNTVKAQTALILEGGASGIFQSIRKPTDTPGGFLFNEGASPNGAQIRHVWDGSAGRFEWRQGANTLLMRLNSNGDLGVGTETISVKAEINGVLAADSFVTLSESGEKNDLGPVDNAELRAAVRGIVPRAFTKKIPWEYRDEKDIDDFEDLIKTIKATYDKDDEIKKVTKTIRLKTAQQQFNKYVEKKAGFESHINYTRPRIGIYLDDTTTPDDIILVDKNGRERLSLGLAVGKLLAIVSDQQRQIDALVEALEGN